ncbi:MAG: hypothetical protein JW993_12780 [Sedimentisphaerales bacterium]|nr:hypothetical protein [Sedimentisphaerales bacterium]
MRKKKQAKLANALAAFALVLTTTTVVAGTVLYVDLRAPFGTTDHRRWETAYNTLQEAVQDAFEGDEIRVAQGVYMPDRYAAPAGRSGESYGITVSGSRSANFSLRSGVVMKGGYAGLGAPDPNARDIEAYPSILSGDLLGNDPNLTDLEWQTLADFTEPTFLDDNSYTVVTLLSASEDTLLDGFTVTGAYGERGRGAYEAGGFIVPAMGGRSAGAGGAVWINGGRPAVSRCTFTRNITRSQSEETCGGPALVCAYSQATIHECSFIENIAFGDGIISTGGAVLNVESEPNLIDCAFTRNVATGQNSQYVGGAIANFQSNPVLVGCSFVGNSAFGPEDATVFMAGGAVFNDTISNAILGNCRFESNSALLGGGMYNAVASRPTLTDCVFLWNWTLPSGRGGALYNGPAGSVSAAACHFVQNGAATDGGAVYEEGEPNFVNCIFTGNTAESGAALYGALSATLSITNCTLTANHAFDSGGAYYARVSAADFANCILWDNTPEEVVVFLRDEDTTIRYCDIQGGWAGEGNIDADPLFLDPLGPDGVAGTIDDDLRLPLGSPCLDAGDDAALPPDVSTDPNGEPRIVNSAVDMGAYEYNGPLNYYVDGVNGSDTNGGWAPEVAFATIQKGIDTARSGYRVIVLPGVYTEEINFTGKALTVMGSGGAPLLEAPDGYAVSCFMAETRASVLKNFVIRHSDVGIFLAGASPTITNVTLVDNKFGIAAYAGSNPDISSCILWGNAAGDLFDCTARYSCIERPAPGEGNISEDPLFGDPANGDYHLFARGGRYVAAYGLWSLDPVTSPCVDAGDPSLDVEAERSPHGGRINMGAFGGTPQASMSLCIPCVGQ